MMGLAYALLMENKKLHGWTVNSRKQDSLKLFVFGRWYQLIVISHRALHISNKVYATLSKQDTLGILADVLWHRLYVISCRSYVISI